jgi:hypothetical protein
MKKSLSFPRTRSPELSSGSTMMSSENSWSRQNSATNL